MKLRARLIAPLAVFLAAVGTGLILLGGSCTRSRLPNPPTTIPTDSERNSPPASAIEPTN